ncbi:MAG: hypothetical protein JSV85_07760, partial [Candidatus Bathyarchaeota archaeon]
FQLCESWFYNKLEVDNTCGLHVSPRSFYEKASVPRNCVSKSKKTNKRELIKDVLQQEKDVMLEDTPRKTTTQEWESRKDFSKNS